jgi:hypothetical protein
MAAHASYGKEDRRRSHAKLGRMSSTDKGPLPSGTVTFLFTDVEGSTRLWAADKDAMSASLLVHDSILRTESQSALTNASWPGPVGARTNRLAAR